MNCPKCGAEIKEGDRFCMECGAPIEDAAEAPATVEEAPVAAPVETSIETPSEEPEEAPQEQLAQPVTEPEPEQPTADAEPKEEPAAVPPAPVWTAPAAQQNGTDPRNMLTTVQYFFLMILFRIPIVGLVFLFVWSLGKPRNLSLKRFALATLLLNLIGTILALICLVFALLVLNRVIPGVQFILQQ